MLHRSCWLVLLSVCLMNFHHLLLMSLNLSSSHHADCELWADTRLPGLDQHLRLHHGTAVQGGWQEGCAWTVQLCIWTHAWQSVRVMASVIKFGTLRLLCVAAAQRESHPCSVLFESKVKGQSAECQTNVSLSGKSHSHALGQMIMEYDPPIKKLAEEFIPHSKVCSVKLLPFFVLAFAMWALGVYPWRAQPCSLYLCPLFSLLCFQCLTQALLSLQQVYPRRALRAEDWRAAQMLSLLSDSSKIMNVAQIDTVRKSVSFSDEDHDEMTLLHRNNSCHGEMRKEEKEHCVTQLIALNLIHTTALLASSRFYPGFPPFFRHSQSWPVLTWALQRITPG